jgi:hypothetical protein
MVSKINKINTLYLNASTKQTKIGPTLNNALAVPIGIYFIEPRKKETVIELNIILFTKIVNACIFL